MPMLLIALALLAGCALPSRKAIWTEEFDGVSLDARRWNVEVSSASPPNAELQCYTDRKENARVESGVLILEARREDYACPDGQKRAYTSGKIESSGKYSRRYGRVEARIRVPRGQGIWPAFWMLGQDFPKTDWPDCGEIDIMENIGREPDVVHGTIHGPGYFAEKGPGSELKTGAPLADAFHVYAVEWAPAEIRWYFDGKLYGKKTPADIPAGTKWVYDQPFFVILNVAVGGLWPGNPDATSAYPQRMEVDWVRVYER